jgi:hypothetical protein
MKNGKNHRPLRRRPHRLAGLEQSAAESLRDATLIPTQVILIYEVLKDPTDEQPGQSNRSARKATGDNPSDQGR